MAEPRRRRPTSRRPATGPVTLAQARTRARAQQTRRQELSADATNPAPVAIARRQLAIRRREERQRRIREYTATMAILKRRGVRGLVSEPLQILAEGDSWFDYPVPFFGGGIVPRLENRLGVPILNLAKAGDEVRYMLGVKERKELIERLTKGCPAGGKWDVVLFSGGGNDIVDNPMALWIREYDAGASASDHIHQPRLDAALALVRAGYEDLIALRDDHSRDTRLILHAYDFAIPDGRGVCHHGPWLEPTFELRKFPTLAKRFEVMTVLLAQFAAMLEALLKDRTNVTFINGQGTLDPVPKSWHNELHPNRKGFDAFAGLFHVALKQLYPTRVL